MNHTTLTTQVGVVWDVLPFNSKAAFRHNLHTIVFNAEDGKFHVLEMDQSRFAHKNVSECLNKGSEIVLDSYADTIVPMWER